jgi:hypothetical protein
MGYVKILRAHDEGDRRGERGESSESRCGAVCLPWTCVSVSFLAFLAHSSTNMHPLFGSNDLDGRRKRQINLGGLSSNASQTALLEQAKARREERDAQKRRAEAAVRVQAWWRGESEGKRVRNGLKQVLRDDTKGINGLRALVLIGRDEDALALWSSNMDQAGMLVLDQSDTSIANWGFTCSPFVSLTRSRCSKLANAPTTRGSLTPALSGQPPIVSTVWRSI